jgi:hypothetical protein
LWRADNKADSRLCAGMSGSDIITSINTAVLCYNYGTVYRKVYTQGQGVVMTRTDREKNLIIVAAIDRYADIHGISNLEAFNLFQRYGLLKLLRDHYDTLHTQGLFEGALFAEDYIARNTL